MRLTYETCIKVIRHNPDIFDGLMLKHRKSFMDWLPDNVHVVSAFGLNARLLKDKGNREYYSAYAIREKLRWDSMVSEVGTNFKLSNNMTPFVARLIMAIDPELEDMFKTKGN